MYYGLFNASESVWDIFDPNDIWIASAATREDAEALLSHLNRSY